MKKVLFATTALVASAGIAAADVTVSGFAEMGMSGGDGYGAANDDLQFHSDIGVTFTMSGETDGGLSFGSSFQIDDSNGAGAVDGAPAIDDEMVFISGAFGTLTLGEIDGALDNVISDVAFGPGSIADSETTYAGFASDSGFDGTHDNQILRYDYAFGDFGFSISYEQANNGQPLGIAGVATQEDNIAVGVSYDTDLGNIGLGFGLAYQSGSDTFQTTPAGVAIYTDGDVTGVGVTADFNNGFEAAFTYHSFDFDTTTQTGGASAAVDYDQFGLGVAYSFDAWTFGANYGMQDYDDNTDAEGFGIDVGYDLGGGASVLFGYGSGENRANVDGEFYSLGVAMSF